MRRVVLCLPLLAGACSQPATELTTASSATTTAGETAASDGTSPATTAGSDDATSDAETTASSSGTANDTTTPTTDPSAPTTSDTDDPTTDATTDDLPPLDVWDEHRGILHVHSPYSHDACDGEGLMNGVPNASCLADLRAAICAAGLDFVHLTDHPSFMRDYPFDALVLYEDGDALILEDDAPIANRVACPEGGDPLIDVGYESTHTLPLGMRHHVADAFYAGLTDDAPLADGQALVAALQEAGAVVGIAHSEEDDLSAQRIIDVGLDAMEWYNPHGNFLTALGGDNISGDLGQVLDLISGLSAFMVGADSGAHPDLVYLWLLPSWPQEGFDKWREVLRTRPITGIMGSDVHQNVRVDPICALGDPLLQAACVAAAQAALPASLASLVSGGTLVMLDGDRLDSYARVLRWLENRVLLPPGDALTPDALHDALRDGHSYGLFSVFGDPEGFAFVAQVGDETLQIGDRREGPLELYVRTPTPAKLHDDGPSFGADQASDAALRTILLRTDKDGTEQVAELTTQGALLEHPAVDPGAYHVEVWITPGHLRDALGTQEALADHEYLWLITNPIVVE